MPRALPGASVADVCAAGRGCCCRVCCRARVLLLCALPGVDVAAMCAGGRGCCCRVRCRARVLLPCPLPGAGAAAVCAAGRGCCCRGLENIQSFLLELAMGIRFKLLPLFSQLTV